MKKGYKTIFIIVFVLVFVVIISVFVPRSSKQNGVLSSVPEDVSEFIVSYLDACKNDPEQAVTYCHFEEASEKDAYMRSNIKLETYEILEATEINEDLYAFKLHLKKEYKDIPKRYYFVGRINENLCLMNNIGNVPEKLRDGLVKDDFAYSEADLAGDIMVTESALISD